MSDSLKPVLRKLLYRIRIGEPTAFEDAVMFTEQYPEEPGAWDALAYANTRKKDYAAAIAAETRAIALNSGDPALFFERAKLELRTGNYERAVADCSQGLLLCDELNRDEYRDTREGLYFIRAEAFVQLGQKVDALDDLAHVDDKYLHWTIQLRSKAGLMVLCGESPPPPPEEAEPEDDWRLPETPDAEEAALAAELGPADLDAIDATLLKHVVRYWRKVAMVLVMSLDADEVSDSDETRFCLYLRRLIMLADAGAIDWRGNMRRPRFSEVALPQPP